MTQIPRPIRAPAPTERMDPMTPAGPLSTVTPMLAAVVMALALGSPWPLAFAVVWPVMALAAAGDARLRRRRQRRRERHRAAQRALRLNRQMEQALAEERRERRAAHPGVTAPLRADPADPSRWSATPDGPIPVVVGHAEVPSALVFDDAAETALPAAPLTVTGAPVVVDLRGGLAVTGPAAAAAALARAIIIQAAWMLPPDRVEIHHDGDLFDWVSALPHRTAGRLRRGRVEFVDRAAGTPPVLFAVAAVRPVGCSALLRSNGRLSGGRLLAGGAQAPIDPVFVSERQALAAAGAMSRMLRADGLQPAVDPPTRVELSALVRDMPARPAGLGCPVGHDGAAEVVIDLVADGPHALIAGTTGSGKSELLTCWLLSMAHHHPPERVTFLLVDFKGGATFAALTGMPHVVGTVTDLDAGGARRALESMSAEIQHRERELARRGMRSIDEDRSLPRLVIVVDEYAAMLQAFPEFGTLFADLAARGRSLGLHLILSTQHPRGSLREAVLANVGLRICLRVSDRDDSAITVGDTSALNLPPHPVGRAVLAVPGRAARVIQIASPSGFAPRLNRQDRPPRRPWCPPLPKLIPLAGLPTGFGMLDLPTGQRQEPAVYEPDRHGHLLVIGGRGSGKSTTLDALGERLPHAERVPVGVEAAWDVLLDPPPSRTLLLDDVDLVAGRLGEEHRQAFVEAIVRLAGEGPAVGTFLVVTCHRLPSWLNALSGLTEQRMLLRFADRHEYLLAGGDPAAFDPALPPGAGHWNGVRIQVALPDAARRPSPPASALLRLDPALTYLAASVDPAGCAARIRGGALAHEVVELARVDQTEGAPGASAPGAAPRVLVGSVADWSARWPPITGGDTPLILDGCTVAEFRLLTGIRDLPPPSEPGRRGAWLVHAGTVQRVRLQ